MPMAGEAAETKGTSQVYTAAAISRTLHLNLLPFPILDATHSAVADRGRSCHDSHWP